MIVPLSPLVQWPPRSQSRASPCPTGSIYPRAPRQRPSWSIPYQSILLAGLLPLRRLPDCVPPTLLMILRPVSRYHTVLAAACTKTRRIHSTLSLSQLHQSTSFEYPPTILASDDQTQYDVTSHVSDCLLYDREIYACPSPILTMIGCTFLDTNGLGAQPCKLFLLTAECIPVTGLQKVRPLLCRASSA